MGKRPNTARGFRHPNPALHAPTNSQGRLSGWIRLFVCLLIVRGSEFHFLLLGFEAAKFSHPLPRIHRPTAFASTAVTGGRVYIVIEAVVPDQFLARRNVALGK